MTRLLGHIVLPAKVSWPTGSRQAGVNTVVILNKRRLLVGYSGYDKLVLPGSDFEKMRRKKEGKYEKRGKNVTNSQILRLRKKNPVSPHLQPDFWRRPWIQYQRNNPRNERSHTWRSPGFDYTASCKARPLNSIWSQIYTKFWKLFRDNPWQGALQLMNKNWSNARLKKRMCNSNERKKV